MTTPTMLIFSGPMETNNVNDDNMVENPSWQEADQLVFSNANEEQQLHQITEGLQRKFTRHAMHRARPLCS